jgi:hypothetical protein
MIEKVLMKIERATCGMGGYQDACFGYSFTFGGSGLGTGDFWGTWAFRREGVKWTEEDRAKTWAEANLRVIALLEQAHVSDVSKLVGVPVEVTFENQTRKSWRILTEVL